MDELHYLNYLEEIENAEEEFLNNHRGIRQVRNPVELSDYEFKKLFRLNKELFDYLIELVRPYMREKIRATDLDIPLRVLCALRFFGSGGYQTDIGCNWFIGISQASVSRSVNEVADILNRPEIMNQIVQFPPNIQAMNVIRRSFFEKYEFPGNVGCIDCTHVAIFPPKINDQEHPEHVYVNRKGYHSINVQLICDADLKILNVNARFPGSTHDSFIWNESQAQIALRDLHVRGHTDYFLLGDSGYPLRTYLITPITPEPVVETPEYRFNLKHKSVRSIIERCNGVLKTRFRCLLKHRVLHYDPQVSSKIINACVVLHNLCIEYNVDEPDDIDEDNIDFGIDDAVGYQNENIVRGIGNVELAEGRQARRRLVQNLFG